MNIFALSVDPVEAARLHCDKHVVKMVVETAQMLSTAHHVLDGESPAYKPTHTNHPCSIWARESCGNYTWTVRLLMALGAEYTHRYSKDHKTIREHGSRLRVLPQNIPLGDMTPFALAMPDEYKQNHPVQAYRAYYRGEKFDIAKYTGRDTPEWMQ